MSRLDSKFLRKDDVVRFRWSEDQHVDRTVDAVGLAGVLFVDGSSLYHDSGCWNHAKLYRPEADLPLRIGSFVLVGRHYYPGNEKYSIDRFLRLADEIKEKLSPFKSEAA